MIEITFKESTYMIRRLSLLEDLDLEYENRNPDKYHDYLNRRFSKKHNDPYVGPKFWPLARLIKDIKNYNKKSIKS